MVSAHWSLLIGYCSLVIRSLVIGHWSLLIGHLTIRDTIRFKRLCEKPKGSSVLVNQLNPTHGSVECFLDPAYKKAAPSPSFFFNVTNSQHE